MDSILTGKQIHMEYLMIIHMISCCESTTRVLPYDRFLAKVFNDVGVDLSREIDFEDPIIYDTYDEQSLGRMKFDKAPDPILGELSNHRHRPGDRDRCIPE